MMDAMTMCSIIARISFLDWECLIEGDDGGGFYLVWEWTGTCAVSGDRVPLRSRKWRLSKYMTESELVQTAFAAVLAAVEHEAREAFTFEATRPFHPHIDVRALMKASEHVTVREEQPA